MSDYPSIVETARLLNCLPERQAGDKLVSGNCPGGHGSDGGRCFFVYPDTDSWYCWHCNCGGSAFDLIMLAKQLDFHGAVEWAKANKLIQDNGFQDNNIVFKILTDAVRYFHSQLPSTGREHLSSRYGLTDEVINQYSIGYAPTNEHKLFNFLKDKYEKLDLEKTGLFKNNKSFYIGQIIFPYWRNGLVRYLIGRQTKTTPAYKKGKYEKLPITAEVQNKYFYGEDSIKNTDTVYVTEGVTDCLTALQYGLPSISPVTTQFKKADQPKLLELIKNKTVFLIPDNEISLAGMRGAESTAEFLRKNNVTVHIITLPRPDEAEKIDFNEYMISHSLDDFKRLVDEQVDRDQKKNRGQLVGEIKDWIEISEGQFFGTDIDRDLVLISKEQKINRKVILHRLVKDRVIERIPGKSNLFRKVDNSLSVMDLSDIDETLDLGLKWPFGIERYCYFYPKSIGVVAGSKDAGKTAYLLNLAAMNADTHDIYYFNSEMGMPELVNRLKQFGMFLEWWQKRVKFIDDWNYYNIQDKVQPNGINIIDYLEETERSYELGIKIAELRSRMDLGSVIVGLQKNKGNAYARGGEATLQKARIYITLDNGELKIIVGKLWRTERNPKNMTWQYKLVQGYNFIIE